MTRKFFTIPFMMLFLVNVDAFALGSDSKNRNVSKKCREFRDAVREGSPKKINTFFSKSFMDTNREKIAAPDFYQQKQRILTKIFINEKYRPQDSIFLPRAQFRALEAADGNMVCLVSKNGEDENPELHTVRSIRLIEEDSEWKVSELKVHDAW